MTTDEEAPQRGPELAPSAPAPAPAPTAPTPPFKVTPIPPPQIPQIATSIPQKRVAIEDDHAPAVGSPLNPDSKPVTKPPVPPREETAMPPREKRTKKETLKKRESKGPLAVESSRATPEPKRAKKNAKKDESIPVRYKLSGPVKSSDFDLAQGPVFRSHHEITLENGESTLR